MRLQMIVVAVGISLFSSLLQAGEATWQSWLFTLENKTEIELHFQERDRQLALRVQKILEQKAPPIMRYFNYYPSGVVHFNIDSDVHVANGSATVFPHNLINLYNYPPLGQSTLSINQDWTEVLVIHEFAHIMHMDQSSGFPKFLRTIFGAVMKWNGVTPRWFAEGLAVWIEGHFSKYGRLRSQLLNWEVDRLIADKNFCDTIDCLDRPETYPGGSAAYWIGARLFEFIEASHPGAIACLVRENSDSIPFFLNSAFEDCTGKRAQEHMSEFIAKTRERLEREEKHFQQKHLISHKAFELDHKHDMNWGEGVRLLDGELVYQGHDDDHTRLYKGNKEISLPKSLRQIPYWTDISYEKKVFPIAFETALESKIVWYLWNGQNDHFEQLDLEEQAEYVFLIGEERWLLWRFKENRWQLFERDKGQEKLRFQLPEMVSLSSPYVQQGTMWFSLFNPFEKEKSHHLLSYELASKELKELSRSDSPMSFLGGCQKSIFIRERDELKSYSSKGRQKVKLTNMPVAILGEGDRARVLYRQDLHRSYELACSQVKEASSTVVTAKKALVKKHREEKTPENVEERSYPRLSHFLPKYWLFGYSSGTYIDEWNFYTSLNDPKRVHNFGLQANFFTKINKWGPDLYYRYNRDDYFFGGGYQTDYTWSNSLVRTNKFTDYDVYTGYLFKGDRVYFRPTIRFQHSKISDFISSRTEDEYGFSSVVGTRRIHADDFLQRLDLEGSAFYRSTDFKNYWGAEGRLKMDLRLFSRFFFRSKASYGKLFKNDFASGVLFGGESLGGNNYFYDFYGIPYTDIFGNKIFSARGQFDINLWKMFTGNGFFPLYFKELHVLLGADYLKAERFFFDNFYFKNESIYSLHVTARFKLDIAYFVPSNVDFIIAEVRPKYGDKEVSFLINITSSLYP